MPDTTPETPAEEQKYVSKVVYGNKTLIDLTGDTVTADKLLTGYTAHGKDGAPVTGTCDFDVNSQDGTAAVSEILTGKTAYARGVKLTGTMPNNEAIDEVISNKDDVVTIAQGYHDGSGKVKLDPTEVAKLDPENIREGVEIFGVTGTMTGTEDVTAQARSVTPSSSEQIILPEEGYNYLSQVTVAAIPYVESDNAAGGITVTIGG